MTNQTNEAAERSAHVTRGEKSPPAEWPVVRMPDGTWKLKSVVALETRIAELEAALQKIVDSTGCCEACECWRRLRNKASAAMKGGKDGSA